MRAENLSDFYRPLREKRHFAEAKSQGWPLMLAPSLLSQIGRPGGHS
jgi:hypothetical protein